MAASIKLDTKIERTDKGTVKLTLTTTGTNIDSKVFAIEVLPRSTDKLSPIYRFSHVCSPAELVEFPDTAPEDNCYFRTDCIEMIFDTIKIVDKVLYCMRTDIRNLVNEYNKLDKVDPIESSIVFA